MKRILVVVIICLVIAVPLFSLGQGERKAAAGTEGEVELNALGTFPIVNQQVPISILTFDRGTASYNDNWLVQHLEEKYNVDFVFETAPPERFKEKMNLMFASGDWTDMVQPGGHGLTMLSKPELMKLIEQDVFMPLDDLIEEHMPNYYRQLKSVPGFRESITAPDGHIYGLENVGACYHCVHMQKLWINHTWLDRLGLDVPQDVDEFYEVLKAFKREDANGNGDPNDEWPLSTAKAGGYVEIDGFLMCPFQFTFVDSQKRIYVDNGKIKASFMQPGYREGLKYLRKLWTEELIYPDSFTQDVTTNVNINQSGPVAVFGAIPGGHHGFISAGSGGPEVRWREYIALPPLDGPAGRQTPTKKGFYAGFRMITAKARYPEVIARAMDWGYTDEGAVVNWFGKEGVSWRRPEEGALDVSGEPALVEQLEVPEDDPYYGNYSGSKLFPANNVFFTQATPQDYMIDAPGVAERFLWVMTKQNYEPYAVSLDKMLPQLWIPEEDTTEIAQIYATFNEFVYESVVRFVTGDLDIDTEWQWFQNELKKIGVERYLEIQQTAYDKSEWAK